MKTTSLKSSLCCRLCILLGLFGMLLHIPAAEPPVTPTEPIILFGKDQTKLDRFYTYIEDKKYEDPQRVFTVVDAIDGAPAIRVSGEGAYGGLITKQEYANYRLVGEFRWGDLTWGGRKDRSRDSGILLHCFGPDGNRGGWLASIEFQIIEGGVGDILVVDGMDPVTGAKLSPRATCEVTLDRDGETVWKQGSPRKEFLGGRINWFGRDPDWDDVLGFRGKQDVESPGKGWTHIEYIAEGDTLKYYVNGVFVNEAFNVHPAAGKILFQTEGAELYWRKLELHPLKTSK